MDPIHTHASEPPPATSLPPVTRIFHAEPADTSSHRHTRWDAAKRTELAIFDAIDDCKHAIPLHEVPHRKQVFTCIWCVTHKPKRGTGQPPERARFCLAGNRDWPKHTNVPTSPVTTQRAIRTIMAVASILRYHIHTEDFLRAYLQSDLLPEPVYVRIPPETGEPDDHVWAFTRSIYGRDDAGRHFHFSTQPRYLTIPDIIHSAAFDNVYRLPGKGALCTYVDNTFSSGTPTFDLAVTTALQHNKTHRPEHGNVTLAGLTATSDDASNHCSAGPYTSTLRPAPNSDRSPRPPRLPGHPSLPRRPTPLGLPLLPPRRHHQRYPPRQPPRPHLARRPACQRHVVHPHSPTHHSPLPPPTPALSPPEHLRRLLGLRHVAAGHAPSRLPRRAH